MNKSQEDSLPISPLTPRTSCGEDCEIWLGLINYKWYEVSNKGRVRLIGHHEEIRHGSGTVSKRFRKTRILRQSFTSNGYQKISIKDKTKLVHRLIAIAFHDNPNDYKYVNHIDEVKTHNTASNLEWCTASQNEKHSYDKLGKVVWNKGKVYDTTNAVAVRVKNHLNNSLLLLDEYETSSITQEKLATKYGVTRRTICDRLRTARVSRERSPHE